MTEWTAQIMPDDALDGLVGSMLANVKPDGDTSYAKALERSALYIEHDQLWLAMDAAMNAAAAVICDNDSPGRLYAAEIEALRDWLLPEEDEPPTSSWGEWHEWDQRKLIRDQLTEEAQLAREAA